MFSYQEILTNVLAIMESQLQEQEKHIIKPAPSKDSAFDDFNSFNSN